MKEKGFVEYERKSSRRAISFATNSGVDAMAISAGNTHLQTNKIAKINKEIIKQIQKSISIPLIYMEKWNS